MTTPSPSRPSIAGLLASPRALAAWALLGYVALFQFLRFVGWLLPSGGSLWDRSAGADFRDLLIMALPLLATLIAVRITPPLPAAKLIAGVALIEYAVSLFLGLVTLLMGLVSVSDGARTALNAFGAMEYLILGFGSLVLIGIAAFVTLRAYTDAGGRLKP